MKNQLKKALINSKLTIKQALKTMDDAGRKIVFIVDENAGLLGTVTDGDIRRWILKGRSLSDNVTRVMNKKPSFLRQGYQIKDAEDMMLARKIECLPVLDEQNKVISALWWDEFFDYGQEKTGKFDAPVVIMAGGRGSRLMPLTQVIPKPLIPMGESTVLEKILGRFSDYGCHEFYLTIHYKFNLIKAYFNDSPSKYNINYLVEDKPLGTAGGLHLLKGRVNRTFFVSNCDILIDADYYDILKSHKKNKYRITIVGSLKHFTIPYGVCEINTDGTLKRINEKPESDYLVNTGMYILEPEVLSDIPQNKFYYMTDLINDYIRKGLKVGIYPISQRSWIDIGQWQNIGDFYKAAEGKRYGE